MNAEDLHKLDDAIAAKRAEREKHNHAAMQAKWAARKLSEEILQLESQLPSPKQRRGITMQAEGAKVALKPRR